MVHVTVLYSSHKTCWKQDLFNVLLKLIIFTTFSTKQGEKYSKSTRKNNCSMKGRCCAWLNGQRLATFPQLQELHKSIETTFSIKHGEKYSKSTRKDSRCMKGEMSCLIKWASTSYLPTTSRTPQINWINDTSLIWYHCCISHVIGAWQHCIPPMGKYSSGGLGISNGYQTM
jgi:hypothetical protein